MIACRHIVVAGLALLLSNAASRAPAATHTQRTRLIVLTDFFKDPDDKQSLIRLLTYANEFEIEGLIATSLAFGDGSVRPELIQAVLDEYGKVLGRLRRHERPGYPYPSVEALKRNVKAGAPVVRLWAGFGKGFEAPYPPGFRDSRTCDPAEKWIGPERDTSASRHIIEVVDRKDPRPVWITVWGGAMDLAQAIWSVRHHRTPGEARRFIEKLRVYQISWQDTGTIWLWKNVPELFLILNIEAHRGIHTEGPEEMRDGPWVERNVRRGHGPLGAAYPDAGRPGIKEGDTPSFLHLLARGLSDPEQPEWGGWGGRFRAFGHDTRFFVETGDSHPESNVELRRAQWTVARWNRATSNDFAARMNWLVRPFAGANHNPAVTLNGDRSMNVLRRTVAPGETVWLDAAGTTDPDGGSIGYQWWQYREAGTPGASVEIAHPTAIRTAVMVPASPRGASIHIVLSATDGGSPPLTSYRRMVLTIAP
ncbi:MAG: DUF1593 domain-containing protein [Bryobacterales bacterium]|nr:DUF1593 domain-containing protein [Bryobacterales bacterium]